jgi:hypothetical protein
VDQAESIDHVHIAAKVIQLLDDLAKETTIRDQVLDAIKVYECDVLHEVTWRP